MRGRRILGVAAIVALLVGAAGGAQRRVTEGEMHAFPGGVPPGWKFSLPAGDPAKGKKVFVDLECHACHSVPGQGFPAPSANRPGPSLAGMGGMHPAEYFAESIVNPDAVLVDGPGFLGPDGRSRMPSFNDSLTVAQLTDLVAYLKSLTESVHGTHHDHDAAKEKTVGEYRVRIDYDEPARPRAPGYVRVFVTDASDGTPVPYLPVRIRIRAGKAATTLSLAPVIGAAGPHYGVPAVVPDETTTVTVLIGPSTARVSTTPRKYTTARQVSFPW